MQGSDDAYLGSALAGDHAEALAESERSLEAAGGRTERLCALCAKGLALLVSGRAGEASVLLEQLREDLGRGSFLAMLTVVEIPRAAAKAFAGDLAGGAADLERAIALFSAWGNKRMLAWAHLVLGQLHVQLATGKTPPLPVLRRNAAFLARAMPFARRRARRHLEEAARLAREAGTSGFEAQALIDMGLLYKASRQPAAARDYFGQARRVAEALGAVELISRIDTLL